MILVMKKLLFTIAGLFILAFMIYKNNETYEHAVDKCNAYDYITQKKGCRSETIAQKFPDIKLNTKDPKKSVYDPNLDLPNGYTLLTYAIYKKDYKFAQKLLDNPKIDPHKRDQLGNSILTLLLRQKKYEKADYVYDTLGVRLTEKERRLFAQQLQKDRKKGDYKGTDWANSHDILIKSDELVNWQFPKMTTDTQISYIKRGAKLSPENTALFRKNFIDESLYTITDNYNDVKHLLSGKERILILQKVLDEELNDYLSLIKSLLKDGINLDVADVNKMILQVYDYLQYQNHETPAAAYLLFYLYHNYPQAFKFNRDLEYAIDERWYDLVQSYINNGAVDTKNYKTLTIYFKKDAHLMNLLVDNGYVFTKKQHAQYKKNFKNKEWIRDPQLLRSEVKPLLIAADGTGYQLVVLNTQTHQLTLQRYNEMQQLVSTHNIKGEFYDNKANHLIALYPLGQHLMLVHRRIQDRSVKTVLSILTQEGDIFKNIVIDGDYEKILFENNGFVVQTEQKKLFFDNMFNETDPFDITKRPLQSRHGSHENDNVWTKYFKDKTLRLDYTWDKESILYLDPVTEKKPAKLILEKRQKRVLDIAQSKDAVYLLEQHKAKYFVVKLESDFAKTGYHYIKEQDMTKQEFPYKSSLDTIKQALKLKNNGYAVVGKINQMPALELYDATGKQLAAKAYDFGYLRGHISNVVELESGDLLIVGRLYERKNVRKSFSALLDAKGDPKWSRIYHDFGYLDHPSIVNNKSFLALAYYTPTKFSLADGAIEKRYKEAPYAQEMLVSDTGRLYLIGNKTIREDKKYEPVIYCYDSDKKSYTKKVLDTGNYYIKNLYQKEGAIHALYEQPRAEASLTSNLLDIEITPQCEVDYTWTK